MKKKSNKKRSISDQRSPCPITNMLDILGDKWTLILIRDMLFFEKSQYKEFADSVEKIPTNILADRLKRLESAGLLNKVPYQDNPIRYQYALTKKGMELYPVLIEMIRWGCSHLPGTPQMAPRFLKDLERKVKSRIKG